MANYYYSWKNSSEIHSAPKNVLRGNNEIKAQELMGCMPFLFDESFSAVSLL
jgi:hypothetical protein